MTLLLAAGAGLVTARVLWVMLRPVLAQPLFVRQNYRGQPVVTGAGVVLPVALAAVEAGRALGAAAGVGDAMGPDRASVMVAALGFGLLGLVDDVAGSPDAQGFRGHLAALARGTLTTGGAKLLGGVAVAVVVAAPHAGGSLPRLLADAALVALAANLANLLDRRPGRVVKVGAATFVALAVATSGAVGLAGVAVVAGAAVGLLPDDLGERLMLGDAGANVLGGALGLGVVLSCGVVARTSVLVAVTALNLLSEVVSFSRVIDGVAPLRALDRWGRRP